MMETLVIIYFCAAVIGLILNYITCDHDDHEINTDADYASLIATQKLKKAFALIPVINIIYLITIIVLIFMDIMSTESRS